MYDYFVDRAQAKQEQIWAEIEQDKLINEVRNQFQESNQQRNKMKRTLLYLFIMIGLLSLAFSINVLPAAAHGDEPHGEEAGQQVETSEVEPEVTPLLGNLGDHHHPITTDSELAQRYFNQGLILAYGFNHQLAIQSFKDALKLDPECAMCYWGIAYALGPNINAAMEDAAVPEAYAAIQKAQALAAQVSQPEQAYIQAMAQRYGAEPVADRSELDLAYANAMRELPSNFLMMQMPAPSLPRP
jgi:hypothetical protein